MSQQINLWTLKKQNFKEKQFIFLHFSKIFIGPKVSHGYPNQEYIWVLGFFSGQLDTSLLYICYIMIGFIWYFSMYISRYFPRNHFLFPYPEKCFFPEFIKALLSRPLCPCVGTRTVSKCTNLLCHPNASLIVISLLVHRQDVAKAENGQISEYTAYSEYGLSIHRINNPRTWLKGPFLSKLTCSLLPRLWGWETRCSRGRTSPPPPWPPGGLEIERAAVAHDEGVGGDAREVGRGQEEGALDGVVGPILSKN